MSVVTSCVCMACVIVIGAPQDASEHGGETAGNRRAAEARGVRVRQRPEVREGMEAASRRTSRHVGRGKGFAQGK